MKTIVKNKRTDCWLSWSEAGQAESFTLKWSPAAKSAVFSPPVSKKSIQYWLSWLLSDLFIFVPYCAADFILYPMVFSIEISLISHLVAWCEFVCRAPCWRLVVRGLEVSWCRTTSWPYSPSPRNTRAATAARRATAWPPTPARLSTSGSNVSRERRNERFPPDYNLKRLQFHYVKNQKVFNISKVLLGNVSILTKNTTSVFTIQERYLWWGKFWGPYGKYHTFLSRFPPSLLV